MGLITKEVEVTLGSSNISYFKNKGYELPTIKNKDGKDIYCGAKMIVPISDLTKGSSAKVEVLCDMCQEEIVTTTYADYNSRIDKQGKFLCRKCGYKQVKITNFEKYGVDSFTKTQEYKEKTKATNLKKYGVEYSFQSKEVQEKYKKNMIDKYGVDHPWKVTEIKEKVNDTIKKKYGVDNISQSEKIKEKKANTNLKNTGYKYNLQNPEIYKKCIETISQNWGAKYPMQSPLFKEKMLEIYGVDNPMQSDHIREKIEKTNLERYGGVSSLSSKEVQEKIKKTMYKHGTVPTSIQQNAIYNIYKLYYPQTELNYPIGKVYSGDIVIGNIDFEVDYGGHNLSVKRGDITQEEFNHKQLIRDKVVKAEGYKIVRLITDIQRGIPTDSKLLEILEFSLNYFNTTEHTWIDWDIDKSMYFNAEHREGVLFNFGDLCNIPKKVS